jgi:vitamin B12 transporter
MNRAPVHHHSVCPIERPASRPARALRFGMFALAALGGGPASAQATAAAEYGASARVLRPLAATQSLDASAAGTEIDVTKRDAAAESLADVLLEVPGTRPYRTGSLGSFTSAAVRGAEAEHTAVLFGEIPLTSADAGAFDLSALPLSLAERVVVYRGGAPLWLSQGSVGGILQLVPRTGDTTRTSLNAMGGSFGTYGLTSDASVARGSLKLQAVGSVLGSRGDFPVEFDNKTSLDTSDDFVMRRRNADFVQGNGLFSVSEKLGPGTLSLWSLGYARTGGEPASPADPAFQARRQQLQGLAGASYNLERRAANGHPALRVSAQGSVNASRGRFSDAAGEVGTGSGSLSERNFLRAFGRVAGEAQIISGVQLTALATLSQDGYSVHDPRTRVALPSSGRTSLAAGAELLLHGQLLGHRIELRPSARVEHSRARLHAERFGAVFAAPKDVTLDTYRLAGAVELLRELTLHVGWSNGARTPSMLELFGDGALLLGNVALRPERSRSWDAGLSSVLVKGPVSGSAELRVFDLSIEDQVVLVRNAFSQLLPLNLASSRIRGVEAGVRAQLGRYWLNGASTLLDTEGKPGKRLPNRPRATFLLQPGIEWRELGPVNRLRSFIELQYIASSFDDPDNQTLPKPPALFVDAGVSAHVLSERVLARLSVSDVFDRGGRDLRQFPLPGRTIMVSVTYNEE